MAARVHHHRVASLAASPARTEERRSPEAVDTRRRRERCGEVAAGAAAGCAAACVCFPFAVVELVVLARRRAARAKRMKEMEELILAGDASPGAVAAARALVAEEEQGWCHWPAKPAAAVAEAPDELADADEKEVWARFDGAGFWRSPSQREEAR